MKPKPSSRRKRSSPKSVLRLPDLEHAKTAVLNSLNSTDAKRGYRHAIDEFVDWYCSEPRLAFNRIVLLRYRSHLEFRQLAPGTQAAGCTLLLSRFRQKLLTTSFVSICHAAKSSSTGFRRSSGVP
jgi:hypothetical protein